MTKFEKKAALKARLESIFRRMNEGKDVNEDERYLYFSIKGLNGAETDKEAIDEYLYCYSLNEAFFEGIVKN